MMLMEDFAFVDRGRTFTCTVEIARPARPEAWWWFSVSTDDRHRYAPFRAAADDTPSTVQSRIVAFYDDLLFRRTQPATRHWERRKPVADSTADAPLPPGEPPQQ